LRTRIILMPGKRIQANKRRRGGGGDPNDDIRHGLNADIAHTRNRHPRVRSEGPINYPSDVDLLNDEDPTSDQVSPFHKKQKITEHDLLLGMPMSHLSVDLNRIQNKHSSTESPSVATQYSTWSWMGKWVGRLVPFATLERKNDATPTPQPHESKTHGNEEAGKLFPLPPFRGKITDQYSSSLQRTCSK
jgi:hypothetical protein